MQLTVTFTVGHRHKYFEQVLDSWSAVRNKEDVVFHFSVEPTDWYIGDGGNAARAEKWIKENKVIGRVHHNEKTFGVLHNPYVALTRAFSPYIDYAILAEDDLVVSDDIIEYHKWAAAEYQSNPDISMICSFFEHAADASLADKVVSVPGFASVWIWGTWRDRWNTIIEPTWDHDYSTGNETGPGGWDWNLNKRVLPSLGKSSVQPLNSRVLNIGAEGTHSSGLVPCPSFEAHREPCNYVQLNA